MRAGQVYAFPSIRKHRLTSVCLCSLNEQRSGGELFAVPQLPGRAKRFRPYPPGRRYRRR